jgi:hypothetical protein
MSNHACPRCGTGRKTPDSICSNCRWSPNLVPVRRSVETGRNSEWSRLCLVAAGCGLFVSLLLFTLEWFDFVEFCYDGSLEFVILGLVPYCFTVIIVSVWSAVENHDARSILAVIAGVLAFMLAVLVGFLILLNTAAHF